MQEPHRLDLVAKPDRLDADAEHHGVAERGAFEVATRLALEEIDDAAAEMLRPPGDEHHRVLATVDHRHRAARDRDVADTVMHAAKRNRAAVGDRLGLRQLAHLVDQPSGVTVEEGAGLGQRAARRHGEHRRARRAADAERVVPRPRVTAESNRNVAALGRQIEMRGARQRRRLAFEEDHQGRLANQCGTILRHCGESRNPPPHLSLANQNGGAKAPPFNVVATDAIRGRSSYPRRRSSARCCDRA